MTRHINIVNRARADLDRIYNSLERHSPRGADSWYRAFWTATTQIADDAESFPVADEAPKLKRAEVTAMKSKRLSELHAFHAFLEAKLNNASAYLTPEEALDEWRLLHPEPEDEEDDVAAIQAALDEHDRGVKGIPFEKIDREIRKEFNLQARLR